jgi:hypothetical protein
MKGLTPLSSPSSKVELLECARRLHKMGYNLYATNGNQKFLELHGIYSKMLHWPNEYQKPNLLDFLKAKEIEFIVTLFYYLGVFILDIEIFINIVAKK